MKFCLCVCARTYTHTYIYIYIYIQAIPKIPSVFNQKNTLLVKTDATGRKNVVSQQCKVGNLEFRACAFRFSSYVTSKTKNHRFFAQNLKILSYHILYQKTLLVWMPGHIREAADFITEYFGARLQCVHHPGNGRRCLTQ